MAKKKVEKTQSKADVVVGSQAEDRQEQTQEKKSGKIVTTEGNVIDKIRIYQSDGATMVTAEYGKLQEGKKAEERRKNMHTLSSRSLSAEDAKVYQDMYKDDPVKAKEFAVRKAFPMHVDDAAFHQRATTVNGRKVDYICLEKITADKVDDKNKHLVGQWQLSFGEKGKLDTRVFGLLNKEEIASIRHRAAVTLDDKGQVKTIGEPLSMADIAARFENRVKALREERSSKLEAAQGVDWAKLVEKNKIPEGVTITGLRFSTIKDDPDHVWLNGKVNGIEVAARLSPTETTAVKNKIITLEQAATVNNYFRKKIDSIVAPVAAVSIDAAIKAVVDRAKDPSAKSLTPEQVKTINDFVATAAPEDRQKLFDAVWDGAKAQLDGVNETWVKDAHDELTDLANGIERDAQKALKR